MKRLAMLAAFAVSAYPQGAGGRGAEIFRTTCSVPYCHGAEGAAARAPQLAGTSLSVTDMIRVITSGKSGMPAFDKKLSAEEINAVAQYIRTLPAAAKQSASPGSAATAATSLPAGADRGKEMFFDAVRMGGCGTCHELEGRGAKVGPDLRSTTGRDLRNGSRTRLMTATAAGEDPFPAILADRNAQRVRVYDLSSRLPVLRTFGPDKVQLSAGGNWSHATALQSYTDADLEAIAGYLSAIIPGR